VVQSHQVHLTMLQYYTVHMHAIYSQTQNNTYTKMYLQTDRHVMCIQTWLTGTPHSSQYSVSILGQTSNHSNILSYCMISTVNSSNLINNYSFKRQFNHIIFYHLESFYCSLHCGRQLHSRQKIASDKK